MPEISRFYGIVIRIYFRGEHNPPHVHAYYGEYAGLIEIETLTMIEGNLPQRVQDLVREWGEEHREELRKMWETKTLIKIPPLP